MWHHHKFSLACRDCLLRHHHRIVLGFVCGSEGTRWMNFASGSAGSLLRRGPCVRELDDWLVKQPTGQAETAYQAALIDWVMALIYGGIVLPLRAPRKFIEDAPCFVIKIFLAPGQSSPPAFVRAAERAFSIFGTNFLWCVNKTSQQSKKTAWNFISTRVLHGVSSLGLQPAHWLTEWLFGPAWKANI